MGSQPDTKARAGCCTHLVSKDLVGGFSSDSSAAFPS
jgi:hypothetical protein